MDQMKPVPAHDPVMAGPPEEVRFSEEELRELVKAGEVTMADLARMNPEDRLLAWDIANEGGQMEALNLLGMAAGGVGLAKGLAGLAGKAIPAVGQRIGGVVGAAVGSKIGHPWVGYEMGKDFWNMVTGRGKAAAGAVKSVPPMSPPAKFSGTSMTGGPAKPGSFSMGPTTTTRTKPPVQRRAPDVDDITENVQRGVQNDFRGPVHFEKGPKIPVGTKGDYQGWVDQVDSQFPPGSIEQLLSRLRSSLDADKARRVTLKTGKVALRKPKK